MLQNHRYFTQSYTPTLPTMQHNCGQAANAALSRKPQVNSF